MFRVSVSLAILACTSLLILQMSGLHLHVSQNGQDSGMHTTHVHQLDPDEHDHSGDIDVSLLEQIGVNWSKLLPLLFVCLVVLPVITRIQRRLTFLPPQSDKVRHWLRFRPPLRAPPASL